MRRFYTSMDALRSPPNQRWARDPGESLDHSDPPSFLSLDPGLKKGIGILKVSIPVSKKGLKF